MSMPVMHYVLVIFVIASGILNAIIIFSIFRYRRSNPYLKGSFFALIVFHGAADILLAIEFTVLMRGRKYRYLDFILQEGNMLWYCLPRITNGLHYYLKGVIYMGNIMLSFNRFTSAFYPMNYELFWSSKLMTAIRVFAWILPSAFVLPIMLNFNYDMWFSMGSDNTTVRLSGDDTSTQLISYVDGSASMVATVVCFGFYAVSAYSISRQMIRHGMQRKYAVEFRMFLSSFFIFVILTLNSVNQVWTIIASKQGTEEIVMLLNDISYPLLDTMYSANPWILCATSSAIRDALKRFFLPARLMKTSTVRVVSTTSVITATVANSR